MKKIKNGLMVVTIMIIILAAGCTVNRVKTTDYTGYNEWEHPYVVKVDIISAEYSSDEEVYLVHPGGICFTAYYMDGNNNINIVTYDDYNFDGTMDRVNRKNWKIQPTIINSTEWEIWEKAYFVVRSQKATEK